MSNKKITDLTELTTPTTDDVFPVVDIATNTTRKVQLGNLPTTSVVSSAIASKQDTLVSGTNIKTLNNTSLLGSGNINVVASPSGVAGAIQFSNGSAFASDAANLFWDDTNNRLGIGTNAPATTLDIQGADNTFLARFGTVSGNVKIKPFLNATYGTYVESRYANETFMPLSIGASRLFAFTPVSIGTDSTSAMLQVKGSGSTFATTSLLVQNSGGSSLFSVFDDGSVNIGTTNGSVTLNLGYNNQFYQNQLNFYSAATNIRGMNAGGQGLIISKNSGTTDLYPTALLAIDSTTQGFLPPRMTTTQKNAIATPASGLVVYDSTTNKLCCYDGSTWNDLF